MSSQEDPTNWLSFPFPRAPWGRILRHSCHQQCRSWNISPSFLPARPELALLHPSHPTAPRAAVPRSRFQPAFRSCHLLLCRDTGCGHTETRTHSTPRAAAGSAPGAHSVQLPWNLVGRIQSMQWDSIWEKHFGTQLTVTNSSTRLDSLNASAGVGNFHVFPRFL